MWLISYQYRPSFKNSRHIHNPVDRVSIIDIHPALYIAQCRMEEETVVGMERLGDKILRVYWAIEIPDGLLTDEQIDQLS